MPRDKTINSFKNDADGKTKNENRKKRQQMNKKEKVHV